MAFTLPDWIRPEKWAEWEEHRRQLKRPMTDPGRKRIVIKLDAMRQRGIDHHAAIDLAMEMGWRSVFERSDLPRLRVPNPIVAGSFPNDPLAPREAAKQLDDVNSELAKRGVIPFKVRQA